MIQEAGSGGSCIAGWPQERDVKGSFCCVVNPQMPEEGLWLPELLPALSRPASPGTDKQHTFAHRARYSASKRRAEFIRSI